MRYNKEKVYHRQIKKFKQSQKPCVTFESHDSKKPIVGFLDDLY